MNQWATPKERRALGQARRKQVARHQHCQIDCKSRPVSAMTLLERSMRGRVPDLVRLKYQLMAESPFGYFRGAAMVMAGDLAHLPSTGIVSQLCGDAHARNLGAYAAPDGRLVFDINDFDETIRGPFEWDLKRMAASLVLAGRAAGHKDSSARKAVEACIARYCQQMRQFSRMPHLDVSRFQVHRIDLAEPVHAALAKAERATPQHTVEQLTHLASSKPDALRRFKDAKPMLERITGSRAAAVLASLVPYRQMLEPQRQHLLSFYRPVDVGFKVVGTGSVGLRDYVIYFEGNGLADPLFLQIKEETASAYAPFLPDAHSALHNGQRVAEGQRAMQIQTDPFLGWTHIGPRQYLVRQLNDHKGSIEIDDLAGANLKAYGEVCGELLARGHGRAGDPQVITGYIGNGEAFVEAMGAFAIAYADQTEKDWEQLKKSGKAKITAHQ
jgi:uncharacterized protein (DUF2252 family)